jgi:hypothetical protein
MSKTSPIVAALLVLAASVAGVLTLHPPAAHAATTCSQAYLPLPDPSCQPGANNPDVTQSTIGSTICVSGWTSTVRPPTSYTTPLKVQQIAEYGYTDTSTADYEEDHLIPLELGGAPKDPKNLWPEPRYDAGGGTAASKDTVENKLKTMVCAGSVTLAAARRAIATDWRTALTVVGGGSGGGTGCGTQLLGNPGFETGSASPWSASSGVIYSGSSEPPRTGTYDAWLDGYGSTTTDTLAQSVSIPSGCAASLTFYLHIDTAESGSTAYDKLTVKAGSTTLATYSNVDAASGYVKHTVSLSSYAGQTVTLTFTGTEDSSNQTSFVVDDTAVQ